MSKKFWKLKNSVESSGAELYIDGPISTEDWWGDEATPQQLRDELRSITSKKVTVILNSGGGDVWAGVAMYNALKELDAEVTVRVDGIAASIASVIAMAGDKIIMSPGTTMMIHRAATLAAGNAEDLEESIKMLNSVEQSIIPIYADRTGLDREVVEKMMSETTWMTPEEAVELGFADQVGTKQVDSQADENPFNSFTKSMALSMSAAQASIDKALKAKAEADKAEEDKDVSPDAPETTDEVVDPDPGNEEPEVEEVTKQEEESQMTEEEKKAQAQSQVIEPKNQAPVQPKPDVKAYLKTNAAMDAFARVLEQEAGKSSDDVRNAWKQHLETKMEVTNPEVFLPEALITEIEDAFRAGGEIWNRVTKTGADVWRSAWDTNTDVDADSGRGRGYNRSVEEEKAEQSLTFADRVLRPQMVYKYITLNREDVKNQRSTGALVRFVLAELPRRIIREVERAIVIGDGRAPGSAYKIQEGNPEGFYPIKADATAGNTFAATYTPEAGESKYASMLRARDLLEADGAVVLITKKGYLTDVLLEENANGGFLFPPGTNLTSVLRFDAIIEPDWMESDTDNDAYLVVLSGYRVVGDTSIESFTNFQLSINKQEYLQEIWAGGGLTVRESAVAVAASATS